MNCLRLFTCLFLCVLGNQVLGQSPQAQDKYWVFLTDKGDLAQYSATDLLSERALLRREKHGVALDQSDFPVSKAYIAAVKTLGAEIRNPSRWFNAVSVKMDAETADRVRELPFVRKVEPIKKAILDMDSPDETYRIGYVEANHAQDQLRMIGLDELHKNGLNGTGVLISVMDNGFSGVDQNYFFEHLFQDQRIVATYDFVNGETDVYDQGSHGSWVLSILAAAYESVYDSLSFYGSAHGASYMLFHTENDASETTQEEDNWVAAMEFADSAGSDIITTSLGYREMDAGSANSYTAADMDGNTTIITRGADMAASKGIIVVNSAGNSGSGSGSITAPADGDSVIAVAAVNASRDIGGFSSRGPTVDGRLKPDISAMGVGTAYIRVSPVLTRGNGTSFSCPMISGLLACALQARPETTNMEMYEALIRSGDRYDFPDNEFGYGIPSGSLLVQELGGSLLSSTVPNADLNDAGGKVFPNPASSEIHLVYDNESSGFSGSILIYDEAGRLVSGREVIVDAFYNVFHLSRADDLADLPPGKYFIGLYMAGQRKPVFGQTLILSD